MATDEKTESGDASELSESSELSSESASGGNDVQPVESIAESTAKNIALISAERAASIIGAPKCLVFVAIVQDGQLRTAAVTRDFPDDDLQKCVENLQRQLPDLDSRKK